MSFKIEKVMFEGVDSWNRPVFKSINNKNRFGSVDKLFSHDYTEANVLKEVTKADLCFFGTSFGCEPMGSPAGNIAIVTGKTEEAAIPTITEAEYNALPEDFRDVFENPEYPELVGKRTWLTEECILLVEGFGFTITENRIDEALQNAIDDGQSGHMPKTS